uniref:Cytochrome b5 heme-binding domain-containing protein n=1 Tax=Noctiluca scintillans TaxID=2966 RepID=A0A7S1FK40_NOCSC|mmetsp:Transcript_7399/g.20282  ORF Transcript_7399/g.20282 Transcript_7399/m.20282 type:complete len:962 (+) Transcript_7399:90-2975(+)
MDAVSRDEYWYVVNWCAFWVLVWIAGHHVCWCFRRPWRFANFMQWRVLRDKEMYARRLCRAQVYNALAVLGAVRLFSRCRRLPDDLLNDWSVEHQVLFSMAVGHWVVSFWEDWRSAKFLAGGLEKTSIRGCSPHVFFLSAYSVHHVVAAGGYVALLLLKRCHAVGSFGLLFELPVLLTTHRELAMTADVAPRWLLEPVSVSRYWNAIYLLFLVGRLVPATVYMYSLVHWPEQVRALPSAAFYTYHFMSVFFSLLSYLFVINVLEAWRRRDMLFAVQNKKKVRATKCDLESFASQPGSDEDSENDAEKPAARGLTPVSMEVLQGKDGRADRDLWVAIDGAAFDVTDYLGEHPGGPEILKSHGGKDASQAYHLVGHSHVARVLLQEYLVGPILQEHKEYRLLAHNEEAKAVFFTLSRAVLSHAVFVFAVGPLCLGSAQWVPSAPAEAIVLRGLLTSGGVGLLTCVACCFYALPPVRLKFRDHLVAIVILFHEVGFAVLAQGVPAGVPDTAPSSLEILAVLILFVEEKLSSGEVADGGRGRRWGVLLVCVSWVWRSSELAQWRAFGHQLTCLGTGYMRTVLLSLALAVTLCVAMRFTGQRSNREQTAAHLARAMVLAGIYGLFCTFLLWSRSPSMARELDAFVSDVAWSSGKIGLATAACFSVLVVVFSVACKYSPAYSVRMSAFSLYAVSAISGGTSGYRWITVLGFVCLLSALAEQNKANVRRASLAGQFGDLPVHVIGTLAVWDNTRVVLGTWVWKVLILPWQSLTSMWGPSELRMYACEVPIVNQGNVDLGLCAQFVKRGTRARRIPVPEYFVCNVGMLADGNIDTLHDIQLTNNTLREVWQEFSHPDMRGLVSNVVCVFPVTARQHVMKQVNLSSWETQQDAHDWYVQSKGHQKVLRQHSSGILRSFGNLLVSLVPSEPLLHQDRCQRCGRVVEALEAGSKAPSRCRVCRGPSFGIPTF